MIVHEQLGIYKVKLKLPFRLNHVNCYGIKGSEGWCFIDAGLNNEETRQAWQQFMADQGITEQDVRAIYVTHFHADHMGAAGWLQGITGAPVFITAEDWNEINKLGLTKSDEMNTETRQDLKEMFKAYGVPADMLEGMGGVMSDLEVAMLPIPVESTVEADSMVQLGDYRYRALITPGHSDGHICYFNEEFGVLISGDHLLPKITSNISLCPNAHPDPLNNYLQSLEANLRLPVIMVLPAHGNPFTNFRERIHYLQEHHKERLQLMKELTAGGATVYSICKQVFGKKISHYDLRFAITETAAHMMHLVYRGELELTEREGVNIFNQKNE
ncbi:MAG: MBL fold metallo-hydrolase [Carboxydocellales bacterium]